MSGATRFPIGTVPRPIQTPHSFFCSGGNTEAHSPRIYYKTKAATIFSRPKSYRAACPAPRSTIIIAYHLVLKPVGMANLPSRSHDLAISEDIGHELSAAKAACAPWGAFAAA